MQVTHDAWKSWSWSRPIGDVSGVLAPVEAEYVSPIDGFANGVGHSSRKVTSWHATAGDLVVHAAQARLISRVAGASAPRAIGREPWISIVEKCLAVLIDAARRRAVPVRCGSDCSNPPSGPLGSTDSLHMRQEVRSGSRAGGPIYI